MTKDYKIRQVVSKPIIKLQKIIDENIEHNQCDDGSDDDYTAHIREIAEKTKTRFKNVTMNAKNIYVF